MNPLQITTGKMRIPIVRDDEDCGVLEFDPSDVVFGEKFYRLIANFQEREKSYRERAAAIDAESEPSENGVPANITAGLALLREVCDDMRAEIDTLFGPGTSQMLFGEARDLDVFQQFFAGILPMIKQAREKKLQKYLNDKNKGRVME